jgi:hypothetical protein
VILSCHDGDTAFLAQRWFDRPIAGWHVQGEVCVDSATVCLTPRSIAERISGKGLAEAETLLHDAPELWAQVALDGRPLLGVRTTFGDGSFPLHIAFDEANEMIGWVLELGLAAEMI